ncbi:hypothetical protein SAMN05518672_113133 [Chitinophaga sp. CF118]|uniref:hypothetical protein n=1 Tax=Chitinophaga sp. CF118 TaxID=1884367 RepID=UPI0008DF89F8|nr:hypothetical protein [Chitinophaga sp. CF118]SFE98027.1 hypothetical protein SAMN05518672_113133 [Chitinophaga sp. CF118]
MKTEKASLLREIIETPKAPYANHGGLMFTDIRFTGNAYLSSQNLSPRDLFAANCEFESLLIIEEIVHKNYTFKDCVFEGDVKVLCKESMNFIRFLNCIFKKDLIINGKKFNSVIIESDIEGTLSIESGKFEKLVIGTDYKGKKHSIKFLHIDFSGSKGIMLFRHLQINNLTLSGTNSKESEASFFSVGVFVFNILHLSNEGKIRFSDLIWNDALNNEAYRSFYSFQSNLGKTEFFNFNFNCFQEIEFIQSVLIECVFINTVWPRHYFKPDLKLNEDRLVELREEFRQLKFVLSKQGDSVREHEFHAFEMRTLLLLSSRRLFNFRNNDIKRTHTWRQNLQNWVVLILSWLSSNFGLSWLRPIFFILFVNFFLVYLGLYEFNWKSLFSIFNFHSSIDYDAIGKFLYYCSPFRRFDNSITGKASIFDILIRVVSSYGIYNFIRATRRHVK